MTRCCLTMRRSPSSIGLYGSILFQASFWLFLLSRRLALVLWIRIFLRLVLTLVVATARLPSIASVKNNTLIQPSLFFHWKRRISAIGAAISFETAGKAGHHSTLRLVSTGVRGVVRWLLLLASR